MLDRLKAVLPAASAVRQRIASAVPRARLPLIALAVTGAVAYTLYPHPPLRAVQPGELALRINQFTSGMVEKRDGTVLVVPGLHSLRVYPLRDQIYRPEEITRAAAIGRGAVVRRRSHRALCAGCRQARRALAGAWRQARQ